MREVKRWLSVGAVLLTMAGGLRASSIDYRGNQSVDYLRILSRNASLFGGDLVVYNPAGTAFFSDGLVLSLGNQFVWKTYAMDTALKRYESDTPSMLLPNLYGVYKKGSWAFFAGIGVPLGGGTLKYDDGLAMTELTALQRTQLLGAYGPYGVTDVENQVSLKAKSVSHGYTVGVSHKVGEFLSFSASARYVRAWRSFQGDLQTVLHGGPLEGKTHGAGAALDAREEANGTGLILGFDFHPTRHVNFTLRYETRTRLEYKMEIYDGKDFNGMYVDGQEIRRDLPALFAAGLAWQPGEDGRLNMSLSVVHYFITQAEGPVFQPYQDGWDISAGVEYWVKPSRLLLSCGYLYSPTGGGRRTYSDLDYTLDSHNIALGGRLCVARNMTAIAGLTWSIYKDGVAAATGVEYHKKVLSLGLGLEINL